MWTLILHYSISVPIFEGEEHTDRSPTQRLLAWIQHKIPYRPITNFTSEWNDGIALGALVDSIAPGLCPDWEDWQAKNSVSNATEAMEMAEKWLNVPQVN